MGAESEHARLGVHNSARAAITPTARTVPHDVPCISICMYTWSVGAKKGLTAPVLAA